MNQPSLYQVNTRVWLTALSQQLQRTATLDDIPDETLNQWSQYGFQWIWLLSVWETGPAGRAISRSNPCWRHEFEQTLPDLREEDIGGSGFAIRQYMVSGEIGGEEALKRFRKRLSQLGIKLMLDFVPNHMAPDHPWVDEYPDFFISGTENDLLAFPENYMSVAGSHGSRVFAHGRDPYFPGWPDTLQLNYSNPELQMAMRQELLRMATLCDGVRCDMAMLLLPGVFERVWNRRMEPFWPETIREVKNRFPGFIFMGEVYWDLEWEMQQQGFDYTYDKRLYDRLRALDATPVRLHLLAGIDFQSKLTRFLENHDEQRIASVLPWDVHQAAAIITYLVPGMKLFHMGQMQGWQKKISPHLIRGPEEPADLTVQSFYERLLACLRKSALREGEWKLLSCEEAWEGNPTHQNYIAFWWKTSETIILIVVNYASYRGQCLVQLPGRDSSRHSWHIVDQTSETNKSDDTIDLRHTGLYIDSHAWGYNMFEIRVG